MEIRASTKMAAEGMTQEMSTSALLAVQRPDRLAMVLKHGIMGQTVVTDGKNTYTYWPMMGRYAVTPAPGQNGWRNGIGTCRT